ncbi:MAG: RluA family pseudouridine synthase [Lachnospiraceae bacterium]|nr:RluA family pseudouridine synthase [Lachnospiraceae bacterium]
MSELVYTVTEENSEERLDKCLALLNENFSRTFIKNLIVDKRIMVNGKYQKPSYITVEGDVLLMDVPDPVVPDIPAQDIPLNIVYEDDDVILIDKPKDMVVHPAPGHYTDTLVNALMFHCKDHLSGINGVLRPGIVHRIDRNTTGILIACKNDAAHQAIAKQLSEHSITRRYYALVYGDVKEDGTVDAPLGRSPKDRKKMAIVPGGKEAITHYMVKERFGDYTWIECRLETGRTHQIRVHMSSIHHPLVGDDVYGPEKCPFKGLEGQVLHAYKLGFIHPRTGEYMEFESALPEYFEELLRKLRNR